MANTKTRLEHALTLASVGLKIFPLPPQRKVVYTKAEYPETPELWAWKDVMTSEPSIIRAWFKMYPEMNYGVCPGKDFVVIDLDDKDGKNGVENFCNLNYEQISTDDWLMYEEEAIEGVRQWHFNTFTVMTPSGGYHLYLRVPHPVGNSDRMFPTGVDIRGAGGYVVGPGCFTKELAGDNGKIKTFRGTYKLLAEDAPADVPQWALDKMDQHYEVERDEVEALIELDLPHNVVMATELLSTRAPAIQGSGGDSWTYQTICKIKDCGVSEDKAFELIMAPGGWNHRCEPRWTGSELAAKVKNVYRYGQNAPGNKSDLMGQADAELSAEELELVSSYLAKDDLEKKVKRSKLSDILMSPDDIMASNEYAEMIIPEWLLADGFTALIAQRGSGKTVVMMDMACRLATDMEWHDMPMRKDFAAVYICGEYPIGAREMFRAWCLQHGTIPNDRFFFLGDTCDLLDPASVKIWAEFIVEQLKGRRAVIFVDTWQQATAQGDQSDNVLMQTATHHAVALGRSVKGPVVFAAHPPKSAKESNILTVMGSGIIENNSSGIWHLTEDGGTRTLTVDRVKSKGKGNYEAFKFVQRDLGRTDPHFNRRLTAVYPERIAGSTTKGSEVETKMLEAIKTAYGEAIRDLYLEVARRDAEAGKAYNLSDFCPAFIRLPNDNVRVKALQELNQCYSTADSLNSHLKSMLTCVPVQVEDVIMNISKRGAVTWTSAGFDAP